MRPALVRQRAYTSQITPGRATPRAASSPCRTAPSLVPSWIIRRPRFDRPSWGVCDWTGGCHAAMEVCSTPPSRRCANTWRLDPVCGGDDAAARRAPGIGAEATERAWRRASDARARTEAWRPGAGAGSLLAAGCRLAGVASDRCSVCAVRRCGRRRGRTAHAGRGGRCGERDYVCAGVVATAGARRAGPRRGRRGVGRARRRSRPRRGARETSELGRGGGGKPAAHASHVRACL